MAEGQQAVEHAGQGRRTRKTSARRPAPRPRRSARRPASATTHAAQPADRGIGVERGEQRRRRRAVASENGTRPISACRVGQASAASVHQRCGGSAAVRRPAASAPAVARAPAAPGAAPRRAAPAGQPEQARHQAGRGVERAAHRSKRSMRQAAAKSRTGHPGQPPSGRSQPISRHRRSVGDGQCVPTRPGARPAVCTARRLRAWGCRPCRATPWPCRPPAASRHRPGSAGKTAFCAASPASGANSAPRPAAYFCSASLLAIGPAQILSRVAMTSAGTPLGTKMPK